MKRHRAFTWSLVGCLLRGKPPHLLRQYAEPRAFLHAPQTPYQGPCGACTSPTSHLERDCLLPKR